MQNPWAHGNLSVWSEGVLNSIESIRKKFSASNPEPFQKPEQTKDLRQCSNELLTQAPDTSTELLSQQCEVCKQIERWTDHFGVERCDHCQPGLSGLVTSRYFIDHKQRRWDGETSLDGILWTLRGSWWGVPPFGSFLDEKSYVAVRSLPIIAQKIS